MAMGEARPCNCSASTNVADEISCGTGKLDFYGFWQFPCTHGLAGYLNGKLTGTLPVDSIAEAETGGKA